MAFHDANGRITIDEYEANRDIASFNAVNNILENAEAKLKELRSNTASFRGESMVAAAENTDILMAEIKKLKELNNQYIGRIRTIVAKYKQLDMDLQNTIKSSGGAR